MCLSYSSWVSTAFLSLYYKQCPPASSLLGPALGAGRGWGLRWGLETGIFKALTFSWASQTSKQVYAEGPERRPGGDKSPWVENLAGIRLIRRASRRRSTGAESLQVGRSSPSREVEGRD